MVVNDIDLLRVRPIKDMFETKIQHNGVSHGLAEVGYDIRIKQDVWFWPARYSWEISSGPTIAPAHAIDTDEVRIHGNFCLASAMEEFAMPSDLMGIVHDKSTWARQGLSVFNTVIEPGWAGFLTLELVYHGAEPLHIPAGSGIAQVVFHRTSCHAEYSGKYQNQADEPVPAVFA